MSDRTSLLARIRSEAYALQSRSRNIVDNYFEACSKTEDELAQDIARDLHVYTELKSTYQSILEEAAYLGVGLTLDTSPFPELHNGIWLHKSKEGKSNDPQAHAVKRSAGGQPGFVGSLTEAQREFWLKNELLRSSILRAWTALKDIQWRLAGHLIHEWDIKGQAPDICRDDGVDFSSFTAYDPFVREVGNQGHSSQGQTTDSLSGEDPGPRVVGAEQVPDRIADTIYVHTSDSSEHAPSQSPEVPDPPPPQRKRRLASRAPKRLEPTDHVVGLDTQTGWSPTSVFGPPASNSRLRRSSASASTGRRESWDGGHRQIGRRNSLRPVRDTHL